MKDYWLLILAFLGILYRLWLINLMPQPLILDQEQYHILAGRILTHPFFTDTFRTYGYSLIVAIIYKIFGAYDWYWKIFQIVIDVGSAYLVFLIAKDIFPKVKIAWLSYILYLFNPFSSVYTGVMLPETVTIFIITLTNYLFLRLIEDKNQYPTHSLSIRRHSQRVLPLGYPKMVLSANWRMRAIWESLSRVTHSFSVYAKQIKNNNWWYVPVLGLLLGYLPQVKMTFLFYSAVLLVLLLIMIFRFWKKKRRMVIIFISVFSFITPFLYNIKGNYDYWHQFAPLTTDSLFIQNFYISLYTDRWFPVGAYDHFTFPQEVNEIYGEFSLHKDRSLEAQKQIEKKYIRKSFEKISENPVQFIISRLEKIRFIWEKHYIYPYAVEKDVLIQSAVYWGNISLLSLAGMGLFSLRKYMRGKDNFEKIWFFGLTIFLISYISFAYTFSTAEERYSLPAYPFIFIFAGFGIWNIMRVSHYQSRYSQKGPATRHPSVASD